MVYTILGLFNKLESRTKLFTKLNVYRIVPFSINILVYIFRILILIQVEICRGWDTIATYVQSIYNNPKESSFSVKTKS